MVNETADALTRDNSTNFRGEHCLHNYLHAFVGQEIFDLKVSLMRPGQVVQFVRPSSKVAGSIPGEGIYRKQPMNA